MPDSDLLGWKVDKDFKWLTWKQSMQTAEDLSTGMLKLDMVEDMEAEGRTWRFFGIQAKNCKEWVLSNMAGMHKGMTSVALYDTLGENALKFICNQTQFKTLVIE